LRGNSGRAAGLGTATACTAPSARWRAASPRKRRSRCCIRARYG